MDSVKKLIAVCMGAVLVALCTIALLCDLPPSVKYVTIFAAVYGFFELYKWFKGK